MPSCRLIVGFSSGVVLNPFTPSFLAIDLPTDGSSCMSPHAFAWLTTPALNSDSCRISEATRYGSSPLLCEFATRSDQYGCGKSRFQ